VRSWVPARPVAGSSRAERPAAASAVAARPAAESAPAVPWEVAEDRARRFGHRALELPPPASPGAPIQRVVRPVRGKRGKDGG